MLLKYRITILGGSGPFYLELRDMPWVDKISIVESQGEILESLEKELPHVILLTASCLVEESILDVIEKIPHNIKILIYEDVRFNSLIRGKLEKDGVILIDNLNIDELEKIIMIPEEKEDGKFKKVLGFGAKDEGDSNEKDQTQKEEKAQKEDEGENKILSLNPFKRRGKARGKVVSLITSSPSGKSTLCASLGDLASMRKKRTAIVDMVGHQNNFFDVEDGEWKSIDEDNELQWVAYNRYLHLYENKNVNKPMNIKDFIFLCDSLKEDYEMIIVDTAVKKDLEDNLILNNLKDILQVIVLSDEVLFVQDLDWDTLMDNEDFMMQIKNLNSRLNYNKWHLVINKHVEGFAFPPKELLKYYNTKVDDKKITSVFSVPLCYQACLESKWFHKTPIHSRHVTKEFKESLEYILKGVIAI